ncbi:MAG: hypothetical protein K2L42_01680, partial [Clostridia bacterium]|nr:hypothetical protein [Clostridia bacterium]
MKRLLVLVLSVIMLVCSFFMVACNGAPPEAETPPPGNQTPVDPTPIDPKPEEPKDPEPEEPEPEEPDVIYMEYGDVINVGDCSEDDSIVSITGGQTVTLTANKVGETTCVINGEKIKVVVRPAVVDVVLFVGQSNMVGRVTSKYEVDIPAGQAYEYKSLTDSLDTVKNPSGEYLKNGVTEMSGAAGAGSNGNGSSIVPQFCADYVENTGRKI